MLDYDASSGNEDDGENRAINVKTHLAYSLAGLETNQTTLLYYRTLICRHAHTHMHAHSDTHTHTHTHTLILYTAPIIIIGI